MRQETDPGLSLPLRPQSAHPSLAPGAPHSPFTDITGHLSPGYQETRRSSLSGPCHVSPVSPGFYLPPADSPGGAGLYSDSHENVTETEHDTTDNVGHHNDDPEHNSEVWQDIVRQLAVS